MDHLYKSLYNVDFKNTMNANDELSVFLLSVHVGSICGQESTGGGDIIG